MHRSGLGLGAGDLLWWPASTYDPGQIARQLKFIKPATSFRNSYAYDNVLYLVAGEVIEAVSGQSWEEFVRVSILEPAGMTDSECSHSDARPARQHRVAARGGGRHVRPVWPDTSAATNPAGGIMSSAQDDGEVAHDHGSTRAGWPTASGCTARSARAAVDAGDADPEQQPAARQLAPLKANFRGYALGLNMSDYRG